MNITQLREDLERDEGCVYEVYLDHLGYETFGIGHLIRYHEEEYGWSVGTDVDERRVQEVFEQDVQTVLSDCEKLYDDFYKLPEEAQLIIANMMFNMGYTRLSKFRGMKRGVDSRNWEEAADEMVDSRWYTQVTNRAERLVQRMRKVRTVDIVFME